MPVKIEAIDEEGNWNPVIVIVWKSESPPFSSQRSHETTAPPPNNNGGIYNSTVPSLIDPLDNSDHCLTRLWEILKIIAWLKTTSGVSDV